MYKRPRVIPCLLLVDGGLVKTTKFKKPNYLGDPINAVKIFNEKQVDELCILDITATREGREPDFKQLEDIASEAFMPMSYGGGITNIEQIKRLLYIGFEKVVLNTALVNNKALIKRAAELAGEQSVVVSIDAKKDIMNRYYCVIKDGTKKVNMSPVDMAIEAQKLGAGEIFLNSVNKDGTMSGYDIKLIKSVVDAVDIPVVACGGAGSMKDLKEALLAGNAHAVSAGSLFVYYGKRKGILINFPTEEEFMKERIFEE